MKKILFKAVIILACEFLILVVGDVKKCEPDWFQKCDYNSQCCSNFCYKDPESEHGVCKPTCGRPCAPAQSAIAIGRQVKYGDFPWHATIYIKNSDGVMYFYCSGTLISLKVLISAASCFTVESPKMYVKDLKNFKVVLGKHYLAYNSPEDTSAQIVDIANVEFPSTYIGPVNYDSDNIAFVTLRTKVFYTWYVQPVCIDVGKYSFENEQLVKGAIGRIVGWKIRPNQALHDTLILAEMPFVPKDECISAQSEDRVIHLSAERMCAGDNRTDLALCKGDNGAGLVFEDPETKKYYLRGVFGKYMYGCPGKKISFFTRLSFYKDLVEKYLRLPILD